MGTKELTKKKIRQGDEEWEKYGIAKYITWPRIKAVIEGMTPEGSPIKGEYGIKCEEYVGVEGDVVDSETGNKLRGNFFKKTKTNSKVVPDPFPMSDGFNENAVFFDLAYLEPSIISADLAYDNIAPVLWLCGGCKGEIMKRKSGYIVGETYAVLFDPRFTKQFLGVISERKGIGTVFIVTDADERYRSLCTELPNHRVLQLYKSYLHSFEINAIG